MAHRHYRRRRYRRRRPGQAVKLSLPIGLRVYCAVKVETPEPDRLPRRRWAWCEIMEREKLFTSATHHRVGAVESGTYDVEPCLRRTQELFIKPVHIPGKERQWRWLRVAVAAQRPTNLWWYDGYDPVRLATQLEVHGYGQGYVPALNWRLFDGEGNFVRVRDGQAHIEEDGPIFSTVDWLEKVHVFTEIGPELTADEKRLLKLEKSKTRRARKAKHAKRMLLMWERAVKRAEKRVAAWKRRVNSYEKAAQKGKGQP